VEGYLLTGRHGFLSSYEAFVHVIDSMFNQHAKWLEKSSELSWRADVASLNLLITSTVWRQDHNGFTHQDPGFLDVVANKSASVTRIYLPLDANCVLSVADHCLRSTNYVNVIVADKQPHLQYLDMEAAIKHCTKGAGISQWASSDQDSEPDLVMASSGDIATMEALAATALLRQHSPNRRCVLSMSWTCSGWYLTRRRAISIRRWNLPLRIRSTASPWRSTRSTAFLH
jgi:xylulose-5-phosphate/fructose-6-phosphate phosphoketolase